MSEKVVSCDHSVKEMSGTMTLKLECKKCEKDYSFQRCLPSIILSLGDEYEYDIDSIMISDHMEKQYIGPGVKILTQIRDIAEEIESFSSRTQNQNKCSKCELKPSSVYPSFKRRFIRDPDTLYEEIQQLASITEEKKGCPECMKSLREELAILGKRAVALRSRVLEEGFDIVG